MTARTPDLAPVAGGASLMVAWRLGGRRVLVVGGGPVAAGRARLALDADADVTVVSPDLGGELRLRWSKGEVRWEARPFAPEDVTDDTALVLAAVDDADASAQIAAVCRARRVPVNVADRPPLCDVWLPAVHREGPVQVAVATNGAGPSLAARLRDEFAARLPADLAAAATRFASLRMAVRAALPEDAHSSRRMRFLADVGLTWPWRRLAALDEHAIAGLSADAAAGHSGRADARAGSPVAAPGRVRLVGAGPGDPNLLTLAARDALETADLVVADRLIPPAVLERVRGELRIAPKPPRGADEGQEIVDAWVIEAARGGRDVVRLKIGDPGLFGRLGEELATAAAAGITAEVIPGVSSVSAAAAAAGLPLTCRGVADRLLVLTGQGQGGADVQVPPWAPGTTLVLLMAIGRLGVLSSALVDAGWPAGTPAAIVERATRPDEAVTRATLGTLAATAEAAGVSAPAVVLLGEVARVAAIDAARAARSA